jgi:peroxiredoxin
MRKILASLFVVALVGAMSVALAGPGDKAGKGAAAMKGPTPGDAAPAFSLMDQNGKTVSLSDQSGKIVVVEWFNNECPFVVKHYKEGHMNQLATKYADKGVVWLAVNSTSGKTADEMKTVAGDWKMTRPILLDTDGSVGHAYGATNTPGMYIIDREGKLAYRGAIDSKPDDKTQSIAGSTNYVEKALDEMLAGKPVSEPMTKMYGCSVKYAK